MRTRIMKKPDIEKFREVLRKTGGHLTKTAEAFHVTRSTVYAWTNEDPAFKQAVKDVRGALVDECLISARVLALGIPQKDENGNFTGWLERPDSNMIRYLLATLGKDEGLGESLDITSNGQDIKLPKLTAEDIEELKRINGIGDAR